MKQASKNYKRQINQAKANEREHILSESKSYLSKDPEIRKKGDVDTLTAENWT